MLGYLYYKNYFATGIFFKSGFSVVHDSLNVPFKGKLLYVYFVLIMKQITL